MAGALSLYRTIYWNFKEDVYITALCYTENLAMYGMPYLAFFLVR